MITMIMNEFLDRETVKMEQRLLEIESIDKNVLPIEYQVQLIAEYDGLWKQLNR